MIIFEFNNIKLKFSEPRSNLNYVFLRNFLTGFARFYLNFSKNGKQRAPPRQQFSSSTILNASGGCGYQTSKFRQCDYFSSKNRILDTSSDYYHRNREPVCHSPITNSVLERMLCPNEARVLQRANQIVM